MPQPVGPSASPVACSSGRALSGNVPGRSLVAPTMNEVRIREPFRGQGVINFAIPDDALPSDHRARLLWTVLGTLDLSAFSSGAKSVQGHAGRPLASVRMLLTLWLYAISIGIGSAREIERRTRTDEAFRWIVGDQSVSHARLSQVRIGYGKALDELFSDVLGVLLHKGLWCRWTWSRRTARACVRAHRPPRFGGSNRSSSAASRPLCTFVPSLPKPTIQRRPPARKGPGLRQRETTSVGSTRPSPPSESFASRARTIRAPRRPMPKRAS